MGFEAGICTGIFVFPSFVTAAEMVVRPFLNQAGSYREMCDRAITPIVAAVFTSVLDSSPFHNGLKAGVIAYCAFYASSLAWGTAGRRVSEVNPHINQQRSFKVATSKWTLIGAVAGCAVGTAFSSINPVLGCIASSFTSYTITHTRVSIRGGLGRTQASS